MDDIIVAIQNVDKVICENINNFSSLDRGLLSQNILAQLRNFVEYISLMLYNNGHNIELDFDNIKKANDFVKSKGNLKFLSKFHKLLQISASHYTLDEECSERLMLKYYEYLLKIKNFLMSEFKLEVLNNLDSFPINTDTMLDEYYKKISEKIEQPVLLRVKSSYNDRYYIQKIKPFFVGLNVYYEVTFTRAVDNISKFDRVIAFTKHEITHNYAVKFTIFNDNIQILGKNMPINIISKWEVSIRLCELQNFAKIFGININVGVTKEYRELMKYLTNSGVNLVELIDFSDQDFYNIKKQIAQNADSIKILPILEETRKLSKQQKSGYKVIRYLLHKLNNKIIKLQYDRETCSRLSNLNLKYGCIPFDDMPFNSSLIGHNPKISDVLECIDVQPEKHEILERLIENNTEQKGQLYTHVDTIDNLDNFENIIKEFNDKVYYKHKNRYLGIFRNHIYIKGYEDDVKFILENLKDLTSSGIKYYTNKVTSWLQISTYNIDCIDKENALKRMFENSKVALIYGSAGTGKTTMINHISNFFNEYNKLYLAVTNTAVENLKRRVNSANGTYLTIHKCKKETEIECDILFVDECSTVSNSDMREVLKNVKFKLLVLVGDIYQIESILFGNWFFLAKSLVPISCVTELSQPYRSNDEKLLFLWDKVRNFKDDIVEHIAKNNYSVCLNETVFEHDDSDEIILCLNYNGLYGINNINTFIQSNNPNNPVEWGTHIYKIDDPIVFNETDRFGQAIHNNLKGKLVNIDKQDDLIIFQVEIDKELSDFETWGNDFELINNAENGNSIISFQVNKHRSTDNDDDSFDTIVPFQVAYALSIHKAQGLEFNSVKIVITEEVEEMISHNIFYTAITRAKKKLKIYWSPETENKILNKFKKIDNNRDMHLLKKKYNFT